MYIPCVPAQALVWISGTYPRRIHILYLSEKSGVFYLPFAVSLASLSVPAEESAARVLGDWIPTL